jgi:phage shock protein A
MSKFSRLPDKLRSRVNGLLEGDESSADLDRAYEQMRDRLRNVEQGVSDVVTERKRLEKRVAELRSDVDGHNQRAREAVANDDDETAREELESKNRKLQRIDSLEGEIADLEDAESELLERRDDLAERVEEFRTKKERLKSRKRAAEAKADATESAAGVGNGDAGRRAEGAEEDVRDAQARAAAMDELEERGVFDGPLSGDDIEDELDDAETDDAVGAEIDTIREEIDDEDENEDEQ